MIIKSDYRIASVTDGYGILLRNKHLNDAEHRLPGSSVLFVHGATYGATSTFDYAIDGASWMDSMAAEGFDIWCLDLLGYGLSDRPAAMNRPAADGEPLVDTDHAVREVNCALDFILEDRGIERVSLIGYSWGTAICGRYASRYPDKVQRLVLSGALWVEPGAATIDTAAGAWRAVDAASMAKRWAGGLSQRELDEIVSPALVRQWCEDAVAADPDAQRLQALRAPAGVLEDFRHCAETGEPWYEPAKIRAPTQIVVGELDRETTVEQGFRVFQQLDRRIDRRITVIGRGTHSLLLENNRFALHEVVSGFLRHNDSS